MNKSKSFSGADSKVRLLTFQTRNVLDALVNEGEYLADLSKSRESRDYSRDIEQLNGYNPIWCFSPVGVRVDFKPLNVIGKFSKEDFISGSLFDIFRCEMSLPSGESLNNLVLMEIEIKESIPKIGITHNAYQGAVVIPTIKLEDLVAVYKLKYDDNDDLKWYYPDVLVESIYRDDPMFEENFACKKDQD